MYMMVYVAFIYVFYLFVSVSFCLSLDNIHIIAKVKPAVESNELVWFALMAERLKL